MTQDSGPVLVTGGTGNLGGAVVRELRRRGVPVRVLSRSADAVVEGAEVVPGQLANGSGLAAAVEGARAVVHCATQPLKAREVDVAGTARLLGVLADLEPQAHLVYVSIVGCDANPLRYYRAKADAEHLVGTAAIPTSVVRATQFHSLVHALASRANLGFVGLSVRGVGFQPCDPAFVAAQLVDVALGPALPGRLDVAGPQVVSLTDAVRAVAQSRGRRLRVLSPPPVGGILRALARGSNLPGPDARLGGTGFGEWLAGQQT